MAKARAEPKVALRAGEARGVGVAKEAAERVAEVTAAACRACRLTPVGTVGTVGDCRGPLGLSCRAVEPGLKLFVSSRLCVEQN